MNKIVEYEEITAATDAVLETLNRVIGQYKWDNNLLRFGISGRNPQICFNEHLKHYNWSRMLVIYRTTLPDFANTIASYLEEKYPEDLINRKKGALSEISAEGYNYVYVLLR